MGIPIVGRYQILSSLGSGGMGEVFLASDPMLHRNVALKKLTEAAVGDSESRRRLLHEARAAARLNHPNIAAIYDVIEFNNNSYIVMEYVPGEPLEKRIAKGALAPEEAVQIGIQAAEALSAAHAEGVIHRDLKPANIKLTPEGKVKILDFGLAHTHQTYRSTESASTTSDRTSSLDAPDAGTLPYTPPEALRGEPTDARGDIYSLGVTLFELLTGRRPFSAETKTALIAAITSQRTPLASEINRGIPEELSTIVARAMTRDAQDRYQSAAELRDALRRLATRRSKTFLWLAGAATAVIALIIGLWAWWHPRVPGAPALGSNVVAVLPFLDLGGDSFTHDVAAGITDVVATKLAMLPILVVPLGETRKFRTPDRDLNVVAKELGASLIVDGSVQKYGDRLRVTLKMSRIGSKGLGWTHICDGNAKSVLSLQEEILTVLPVGLTRLDFLSQQPDAEIRARLTKTPTDSEEAAADYSQARAFLAREDMPENIPRAITLFESATRKDPEFAQAFGGLGEAFFAQYRQTRQSEWADKAMQATVRALILDPDDTGVRYSRCVILFGIGALDEAEEELGRVIHAQPNLDVAHSLLGEVHEKQGREHDALRAFRAAIDLRPEFWRHHWQLATVLLAYGRLPEAENEARRVTELQPDNPRGHQLLGTIYQAEGKVDEALKCYDNALKLTPTAAAYSNIGGKFFDERDFTRAVVYYRKAVEIDPKLPVYRRNLGDVLVELGQETEAQAMYSSAVALADTLLGVNPHDANTIALQALCLAKLGKDKASLQRINEAVQLIPSSPNILYKRTAILALLRRQPEALEALKEALAAGLPASFAAQDPDLESISGTDEFKRLMIRYRKGKP